MHLPPDSDEARWQAVLRREATADGQFYYAVRSTGIYCRPACPARRPRREQVSFFETPTAARAAGFRPCRRCQPDQVSTEQRVVAQVQHLLESTEPAPTLAQLGQAVGLSPFHLQRLFKRATGLSPREYAQHQRAERLKAGLKQGASVTDALYAAGFGSSRSLYETARIGMSPKAYRSGGAGEEIAYGSIPTPLGQALVAATGQGVCALRLGASEADLVAELRAEFPRASLTHDPEAVNRYLEAVQAHLAQGRRSLDLPLDLQATPFQQRVWAALRAIPYGEVRSYSEIAAMIGEPTAVRAVARACATNPVALAIPCHRVVKADGQLSGYRWGTERKQALLDQERTASPQPAK